MQPAPLVCLTDITKRFGAVTVLKGVTFDVRPGEVHVLAGENGAGKSTLIKILAGIHTEFEGQLEVAGRAVRPRGPVEAEHLGIAVIHQELSLIGPMTVADNLFLGRPPTRGGLVRFGVQRARARAALEAVGLVVDVDRPVESLPIALQQQVEIAKALSGDARVIVMDEPTSALNAPEVARLFEQIAALKARGCGIVYITHKMEEIERLADRITVLRDGQWIGTAPAAELPGPKLIEWMVGRPMSDQFPRHTPRPGEERLRLRRFSVHPAGLRQRPSVDGATFSVRSGEIVGLAGLQGSGASDLLLGVFGAYGTNTTGEVLLDGKPVRFTAPRQAVDAGVALLTNDRKATGLVLSLSIIANTTLSGLPRLSPGGWRRPQRELEATRNTTAALKLRAASLDLEAGALSGGNQQKVALAKWLQTQPRLLLLDEPTRGIDVGAKHEIYEQMNQWTAAGIAILLITSEMPELLALSDRIVVLHRGRITAEIDRPDATPQAVLAAAMGQNVSPPPPR